MRILILGASYGSLLGVKCAAAGHHVDLVCRAAEADAINRNGAAVRFPVKSAGQTASIDVNSRTLPGALTAGAPTEFAAADYDLVALAMQEPQYRAPEVRRLLSDVAAARVPCLSIMNMPPLPYLERIAGIPADALRSCYADSGVWDEFDPELVTLCSPDAQAVRPPNAPANVLEVRLATNIKAAQFRDAAHTELLRRLERDIEAVRIDGLELPVKLRVHDSLFVPLAKWCMLLTGNYRCVQAATVRSIAESVHEDLGASREIYDWVAKVCRSLGAADADLVPFDKYAAAARSLTSPSSAARALAAGAQDIERVDRLVQLVARHVGLQSHRVDEIVTRVDGWLERNRRAAADAAPATAAKPRESSREPRVTVVDASVIAERRRNRSRAMHFEWLDLDRLTPEAIEQWRALGRAASTPNVYLMPDFLLPAVRHLEADKAPRVAALWCGERRTLLALGAFNVVAPSWRFPVPRLSAVKSKHSFQAGILLRAGIGTAAIDKFVHALFGSSWSALRFNELREDSIVYRQLQDSAQRLGLSWFVDERYHRAALEVDDGRGWREHISRSRHRRLQRARTKLGEHGKVEFRIVASRDIDDRHADDFLRLENNGRKGSALLARRDDTLFFRDVARHADELGLFICELLLDGRAIAATTNFHVNGHGFAFKTGSDCVFLSFCPGFLVEYMFLESLAENSMPGLFEIESGAEAGSFMEDLWPQRVPIVSGHLFAGKLPTAFAHVRQTLKHPGERAARLAPAPAPAVARAPAAARPHAARATGGTAR